MKTFVGLVVGLIIFGSLTFTFNKIGDKLGVASSYDLGSTQTINYGRGAEVEVDSATTSYGYAGIGFALVIAIWAGQAAFYRKWHANYTPKDKLTSYAWLIGLTGLMILSVLIELTFRQFEGGLSHFIRGIIELVGIGSIWWASFQWYKNQLNALTRNENN
jgi:hypothetical protein